MRVIKIGGRAQSDARLAYMIARAWSEAPGTLCVVHGGGDEISALQRALGVEPVFNGGRRVTGDRDIDIVRMALSGSANKRLVARLISAGVTAIGLSGEDATLIGARTVDAALGRVGAPELIDVRLLRHLLGGGYLPVISPVARDIGSPDGAALNVNGDDAAASIAAALGAEELLLVADVPGVMLAGSTVPVLDIAEAAAATERGEANGGMAAKLQAATAAINRGVESVRIGDLEAILDPGRGTRIAPSRSLV
jgi:acetylglutamate kinase